MSTEKKKSDKESKPLSRRKFIKGTLAVGVGVAGTSALAKGVAGRLTGNFDAQRAYLNDVLPGDKILKERGYEEISKQEVRKLIAFFEKRR